MRYCRFPKKVIKNNVLLSRNKQVPNSQRTKRASSMKCLFFINIFIFQVVKARPKDADAKLKFQECNKIVKKLAFEKAIAIDDTKKSVADSIDFESMGKYILLCTMALINL